MAVLKTGRESCNENEGQSNISEANMKKNYSLIDYIRYYVE